MSRLGKRLLYVLLVVVAFFVVKSQLLTPQKVPVATVQRQDVAGEVQGTGIITVDVLATVGAKIPGRIKRMLVNERDFAREGQIIAELEDTDIRRQLDGARARLKAAQAKVQAARATVEARHATEWQTKRAWEREQHLVANGAVSQEEADQYEAQFRTAASAVRAADAEVEAAQWEVQSAEAEIRLQQFNLSQTKIFTYVSGIVTSRPKRAGDAIVPGEPVVTIADPQVTLVDAYVDQRFSGKIRAGQPATVLLRGREHEPFRGRVYRLRPEADPAAEEMTVEIIFPLSPNELQIGQWADVYIQVAEIKDALAVPKSAIMTMENKEMVLMVGPDSTLHQVTVEPLASSPRLPMMAVKGKLEPGNQIVLSPMASRPGQKVRPTPIAPPSARPTEAGAGATTSASR